MLRALWDAVVAFFAQKTTVITIDHTTMPEDIPQLQPQPLPVEPQPAPVTPPSQDMLTHFCILISEYEGGPGDRNHKNNNPGNCRYSSVGYASMYGVVKKDKDNFAIFKDWNTGFLYLKNLVRTKIQKNPNQTLLQFMSVYAPASDGNNTVAYANFLAKGLGVDNSFVMKGLLG